MAQRIKILDQNIIYELMDTEGILLDIERGIYYSLNNSGRNIWSLIDTDCTGEEIAKHISNHYRVPQETIQSELEGFINTLRDEGLIEVTNDNTSVESKASSTELNGSVYETPQLDVYTDLQDLLMIDPIHEVDYKGWPAKQADA